MKFVFLFFVILFAGCDWSSYDRYVVGCPEKKSERLLVQSSEKERVVSIARNVVLKYHDLEFEDYTGLITDPDLLAFYHYGRKKSSISITVIVYMENNSIVIYIDSLNISISSMSRAIYVELGKQFENIRKDESFFSPSYYPEDKFFDVFFEVRDVPGRVLRPD